MNENENLTNDYQDLNNKFLHSLIKGVRNIFLLWLLSKERMHGYAIMSKINESYNCRDVKLVHGSTIYPILHSLENDGLIQSFEEFNGKNRVKSYETTAKGIKILNSIKHTLALKPEYGLFKTYLDEMIFNDEEFVYEGVNK